MEGNLQCAKHEEQIKTLFKQDEVLNKKIDEKDVAINKKVDGMDWMRDTLTKLTTLMEVTIEDNKRRDDDSKRRDNENRIINEKQNETLGTMSKSLIKINNSMNSMNNRIGALEEKVEESEEKNTIDLRDINKKKYTEILVKYVFPVGGALVIVLEIIKVWKG